MRRRPRIIDRWSTSLRGSLLAAVMLFMAISTIAARAQQNAPDSKPGSNAPAIASAPAPPPVRTAAASKTTQSNTPMSSAQALYLVRSTLLTLNDANRSGNYTVLRDLAAPGFQANNTAADLGQLFADIRRRNFDLFAAALLTPQFTSAPALDAEGRVHLMGFFPTRPLEIGFDLTFQSVAGQWRLFAISVSTPAAPAAATPPQGTH
jgi:hypothetical protein